MVFYIKINSMARDHDRVGFGKSTGRLLSFLSPEIFKLNATYITGARLLALWRLVLTMPLKKS